MDEDKTDQPSKKTKGHTDSTKGHPVVECTPTRATKPGNKKGAISHARRSARLRDHKMKQTKGV